MTSSWARPRRSATACSGAMYAGVPNEIPTLLRSWVPDVSLMAVVETNAEDREDPLDPRIDEPNAVDPPAGCGPDTTAARDRDTGRHSDHAHTSACGSRCTPMQRR